MCDSCLTSIQSPPFARTTQTQAKTILNHSSRCFSQDLVTIAHNARGSSENGPYFAAFLPVSCALSLSCKDSTSSKSLSRFHSRPMPCVCAPCVSTCAYTYTYTCMCKNACVLPEKCAIIEIQANTESQTDLHVVVQELERRFDVLILNSISFRFDLYASPESRSCVCTSEYAPTFQCSDRHFERPLTHLFIHASACARSQPPA
jgi:hypothetical protein